MKKAEIKQAITEAVNRWMPLLGLGHWEVFLEVKNKPDSKAPGLGMKTAMRCSVDWRYSLLSIEAYRDSMKGMDADDVERCAVHEMAHALADEIETARISADLHDHIEHVVVCSITDALFRVRKAAEADECRQS